MSRQIRIPDDTIKLLDGVRQNKTYGEMIREMTTNEVTVNTSELKKITERLDAVSKQLTTISEKIDNLKKY